MKGVTIQSSNWKKSINHKSEFNGKSKIGTILEEKLINKRYISWKMTTSWSFRSQLKLRMNFTVSYHRKPLPLKHLKVFPLRMTNTFSRRFRKRKHINFQTNNMSLSSDNCVLLTSFPASKSILCCRIQ